MQDFITIISKRFSDLLRSGSIAQDVSCNYGDNYYGDKKCCSDKGE